MLAGYRDMGHWHASGGQLFRREVAPVPKGIELGGDDHGRGEPRQVV
jgi:hypothetical protein